MAACDSNKKNKINVGQLNRSQIQFLHKNILSLRTTYRVVSSNVFRMAGYSAVTPLNSFDFM